MLGTAQSAAAGTFDVIITSPLESDPDLAEPDVFFSGQADPGDTITVDVGSGPGTGCSAIATDNGPGEPGTWICEVTGLVTKEFYVITASRPAAGPAQDSDGREYSVVLPPTIDGLSGGQITSNDAQPTISGTADPFASLDATMGGIPCLTDNGGLFNPIVANAAGNWTCEPNVPMAGDGSYGINVTQTPTWAAAPSPAAVGTYVFDSTPPDQPIITAPANPTVTGDLFQPVSGTGEVGTTVRVRWAVWPSLNATGDYCQSLVDSFGAWSCVPDVARSPGESINVGVFAIDAAGNNSGDYDTNRNLVFLGKPTINGQLGGDTILGNDPTPTFTGTGYPGADIRIQIEGAGLQPECDGVADGAGNWTCTVPSPLTDGDMQYELNTYQSYGGGPETTIYQAYYILDTTVDVPRFTSPVDTTGGGFDYPLFSSVQFPQFTGVAEAGAQVTVEYSVGIGGSPSYSVYCSATADPSGTFACSDGPQLAVGQGYSFAAGQVDPAGNVANAFIPQIDYTVVEPPPAPTLDSPAAGYSAVNPYVFFSGHRNGPFGSPHIYVDGVETCTLVTTEVDFSCTGGPYAPGSHAVQTFLVDDQGTHSTSVFTVFTINAPTLPPGVKAPPVGIAKLVWTLTVTDKDGKDITGKPIKAGDVVFFSSSGLPAGAVVTAVLHSDPIDLGSTVVGADGKFLLKATVPKNAPVGPHNFVVTLTPADQDPSVIEAGVPVEPADEEPAPTKQVDSLTKAEILAMLAAQHPAPVQDGGWNSPTSFSHTLKTVQGIPALLTPVALGITGLVASAFLLLVAFPTELLQSTITENYERVFGWLEPIKRRFARAKAAVARVKINPWLGGTLLVAIAAVILGFSDPGFGFNGASVRLWVALMISLVVMNVAVSAIVMAVSKRRFSIAGALEPLPAALILVAVSVLVSRLLDIQPGFLFAAVLGVAFAGELRKKADGQLALLGVGLTLVIGLAAWALYSALEGDGTGSGFWYLLGQESLAAITVEALATMCISLLPLEFLDGRPIFAWSKVAWALTYIVALVVFVVVVLPLAGNWGEASAPLLGWGAFFLAFAILAVVAWAVLRFRKPKDAKSEA